MDLILDKLEDKDLVKMALESPERFSMIMEKYNNPLSRYIFRIFGGVTKDEVDDILQNVYIKIYRNLNDYDPSLKFSSWIYRITHNEVMDHIRAKKRHNTVDDSSLDDDEESLFSFIPAPDDILFEVSAKMDAKQIREILNLMDPKYRDVLVLSFLEEKDYKEISDIIKKPMGTVATLIYRAKKQFKEVSVSEKISFNQQN